MELDSQNCLPEKSKEYFILADEGYETYINPDDPPNVIRVRPKPKQENDPIQKAVENIVDNHHQIIDDWCKAYMAQLYEENGSIKPGDFVLYEQVPLFHKEIGCTAKKYWFKKKHKDEEF